MKYRILGSYGLLLALAILFLNACQSDQQGGTQVTVTTNILGDGVRYLLRDVDSADVTVLMGPGVDPHLYKATQNDVQALSRADLIIFHGLHLEGKMGGVLQRMPASKTYAAAEVIPEDELLPAGDYAGTYDPHVWFDTELWGQVIKGVAERLQKTFPDQATRIQENSEEFLSKLAELDENNRIILKRIPDSQRVLVTAHDAFRYFGRAYNMEVRGLQGISTVAEYGIQDVSSLVDMLVERQISAIFVESSVNRRALEAVQEAAAKRGHDLKIGGELYSDALGSQEDQADTYLKMFSKNVQTITVALE